MTRTLLALAACACLSIATWLGAKVGTAVEWSLRCGGSTYDGLSMPRRRAARIPDIAVSFVGPNGERCGRERAAELRVSHLRCARAEKGLPAQRIPRRIVQTGHAYGDALAKHGAAVRTWQSLNPEYEFVFFNDSEASALVARLATPGSHEREAYESLRVGASRADLLRTLLLRSLGGVYVDLDTEARLPLRELLPADASMLVSSEWHFDFLPVSPRHPVMVETCLRQVAAVRRQVVLLREEERRHRRRFQPWAQAQQPPPPQQQQPEQPEQAERAQPGRELQERRRGDGALSATLGRPEAHPSGVLRTRLCSGPKSCIIDVTGPNTYVAAVEEVMRRSNCAEPRFSFQTRPPRLQPDCSCSADEAVRAIHVCTPKSLLWADARDRRAVEEEYARIQRSPASAWQCDGVRHLDCRWARGDNCSAEHYLHRLRERPQQVHPAAAFFRLPPKRVPKG